MDVCILHLPEQLHDGLGLGNDQRRIDADNRPATNPIRLGRCLRDKNVEVAFCHRKLESTMVVAWGEFGRAPKINDKAGRDHWPPCGSVLLAGGGIQGGREYGASDATGAYPHENPTTPGDITATIFHALGLDPETEIRDQLDRPWPISNGRPIHSLFA